MKINEKLIKDKIIKELTYLNFNFSYKGTLYLIEVIYIIYITNFNFKGNFQKDIYPVIALKFDTSPNNVKCNIVNATNNMYYDCDEELLFSYIKGNFKPTPKKIIFAIISKIEE